MRGEGARESFAAVFSPHHQGPGDGTRVVRLGGKHLNPLKPSHGPSVLLVCARAHTSHTHVPACALVQVWKP